MMSAIAPLATYCVLNVASMVATEVVSLVATHRRSVLIFKSRYTMSAIWLRGVARMLFQVVLAWLTPNPEKAWRKPPALTVRL